MLQSLNALAGKISPGQNQSNQIDSVNANSDGQISNGTTIKMNQKSIVHPYLKINSQNDDEKLNDNKNSDNSK